MLLPLTSALRGSRSGSEKLDWSPEMDSAFKASKQALSRSTWLAHPSPTAALGLYVDASGTHVGAVLQQMEARTGSWRPLGFFSKKLELSQQKWSAFDRELWACFSGIRHFRYILEGRSFTIYTDHKPLTYALARTTDPWTARQCRHLSYVAEFTSDIQHGAGLDNVVADALSRPAMPEAAPVAPVISAPGSSPSSFEGAGAGADPCTAPGPTTPSTPVD